MNDSAKAAKGGDDGSPAFKALKHWLQRVTRARPGEASFREAIEEIIEESEGELAEVPITDDERFLLLNILKLRGRTADDIMVPRADIVAAAVDLGLDDLIRLITEHGHSRLPVFRDTLDDLLGMVHMKDVLSHMVERDRPFDLAAMLREVLFVAPSTRLLDLLLEMRLKHVHMALVVDEFGGIDGLVTIEDVVEEIVGEIEDEHDVAQGPKLIPRPDGSLIADARTTIEEFEERVGPVLSEAEREEDIDTLGGLVFSLAGRIPAKGEVIEHASGLRFEVVESDQRRIRRLRIRNLPTAERHE
jgi:CBS domain containing-hemolysin-like protein